MVIFDKTGCYSSAVNCAVAMNSVGKYVINRHFEAGDLRCGIGIDAGPMLATKTGIVKHGADQINYRNLVWLGRPANVASKLTDAAHKPEESLMIDRAYLGRPRTLGILSNPDYAISWTWDFAHEFMKKLRMDPFTRTFSHLDASISSFQVRQDKLVTKPETRPILISSSVWAGFQKDSPDDPIVKNQSFAPVNIKVAGYNGQVFHGDVIYTNFK